MKRLLLLFLIAFFGLSGILKAQPTLTGANTNVQIGEQFQVYKFIGHDSIFNKGAAAGANITWDFSELSTNFTSYLYIVPKPGLIWGSHSFPTATATIAAFQIYDYIQANNDSVNYVGQFDNTAEIVNQFSNPMKRMEYPFTYGSAFSDSYSFVQLGNFPSVTINGNYAVNGEGYGTLILPIGTINNVLKVKSVNVGALANSANPPGTTITYEWYMPGVHLPVLRLDKYIENNSYGEGYFLNPAIIGMKEGLTAQLNLHTFPNPATSEVTIQTSLKTPSTIKLTLTDALGKVVLQNQEKMLASGAYSKAIDISNLPKGIYLVRLETAEQVAVKKLLVQ